MKHYDIVIIGSGWGTKLRPAADKWKKIAIIEDTNLWWTCLNRWCIPSKMLIYPADLVTHFKEDYKKLDIDFSWKIKINFEALVKRVNTEITESSHSIKPVYEKHENIDLYQWYAKFIENKTVEVNGEKLSADTIYIATGSKPQIPRIEWLEGTPYFTSKEALKNSKLPKKMIVIWWWYIAVELWHFYGAAGTDMHFLVRSEMIKNEDKDIRAEFTKDFKERYNLHFWISPTKVEYINNTFFVTVSDTEWNEEVMESDALFVATGVVPNSKELGLENTDIQMNDRWYIKVDDYLETAVKWVYALWDVVWNYLFRHSVNYEWEYLFAQHYENQIKTPIKYPPVPHAIFTYPQIAGVWVIEDELIKEWREVWKDYLVGVNYYKDSAMWMAMRPEVGMVKLISDTSWKLLWAHIIWEKASDIIHMLIVYVSEWFNVEKMIKDMIFIHPALSENIRNAARKLYAQVKK